MVTPFSTATEDQSMQAVTRENETVHRPCYMYLTKSTLNNELKFTFSTHSISGLLVIVLPSRQITQGADSALASRTARAASAPIRHDCDERQATVFFFCI